MIYEPQNILAQEWTFLLAYNSSFPTRPHQFMYLSYGTSVTELLGWISSHAFVRGDANGDSGDLLVFLFNHLFFLLISSCCFKGYHHRGISVSPSVTHWLGGLHPSGMNNLRCDGFEPINSASQKDNIYK